NNKEGAVRLRWFAAFVAIVCCNALAAAEPAWRAVVGNDPLQGKTACLMESAQVAVNDGQTTTPVRFLYNGTAFLVTTKSNIDQSYPNVGLQVDTHAPFAIDRVHKETHVIFAKDAEQIRAQFIRGLRAKLSLGFWPTWPQGETVVAEFSLIGFTKAHEKFLQCQRTGRLGENAKAGTWD
ncbi:MAG: hypothetical protein JSW10_09620, partial [Pseudomonadota bacterium]